MLKEHIKNNADCTIAVIDVPEEEASRFGIMSTDESGRITEFEEKPEHPKSTQASMGVYIFSTAKLKKYLIEDEQNEGSENDFGKNVIPAMEKVLEQSVGRKYVDAVADDFTIIYTPFHGSGYKLVPEVLKRLGMSVEQSFSDQYCGVNKIRIECKR